MGVCGASQICKSKDNNPNSECNMHDKKQCLADPHNNNASNQVSPSSPLSLSSIHSSNHKASFPNHQHSNSHSNTNSNSTTCHSLHTMSKSCNSHKIRQHDGSPSDTRELKLNRSRKSSKYVPLDHDENEDFVRQRATSQEVLTAAEYALLEDSQTIKEEFVTPLTTPSTRRKNMSSPAYHQAHSSALGPLSNLSNVSVKSHSNNSSTENTQNTSKYLNRDNNINVSRIYTRERNLSISNNAFPSSLIVPGANPVPRYNSTSSEFADLVDDYHNNNAHRVISMDEIARDNSELFQWRLSHGSIGGMTVAQHPQQNIADRVKSNVESMSRDQSLTDY